MFRSCLKYFLLASVVFTTFELQALDYNFESYFSTQQTPFSYSSLDPSNQLFRLSKSGSLLDVRLNVRHQTKKTKWITRGRFIGYADMYPYRADYNRDKSEARGKWDLTDLFYEHRWADAFYTVLGLQVYQWGNGELMNPSNPFFHFLSDQRSVFFKEKGKVLARAHLDVSSNVSMLVIAEPLSNKERDFYYDDEFSQKYMGKIELLSDSQKDGISLSYGQERKEQNFIGLTASYEFVEGFSLYMDGRATHKTRRLAPSFIPLTSTLILTEQELTGYSPLALAGARLETENYDIRLEGVFNDRGFSKDELVSIRNSFAGITGALNLQSYLRSGLELPGQRYLYLSVRRSHLGADNDQTLSLRYLLSLQDSSGALLATYEAPFKDSWTFFLEGNFVNGKELGEISFVKQNRYSLGFSYFF